MSRTRTIPPIPDHIDPEKEAKRRDLASFRIAENQPEVAKPPTEGKAN
jgi:hypothetical protein